METQKAKLADELATLEEQFSNVTHEK